MPGSMVGAGSDCETFWGRSESGLARNWTSYCRLGAYLPGTALLCGGMGTLSHADLSGRPSLLPWWAPWA